MEESRFVSGPTTRILNVSSDSELVVDSESSGDEEHSSELFVDSESSGDEEHSEEKGLPEKRGSGGTRDIRKQGKYVCNQCGLAATKPALLKQHMRSHSDQKPFACPMSCCSCAYKRQDHLNRHLKTHQGTVYFCTEPECHQSFNVQSNLQRHLKYHKEKDVFPLPKSSKEKTLVCPHPGCRLMFRFPSEQQTHHTNVHGKLEFVELICVYPGCGDKYPSEKALLKHAEADHPYLLCEVCGETIPRKSFKRHVRMHAVKEPRQVPCPYDGCAKIYTRETNLRQHVRSVHLKLKPFVCSHEGCGKCYAHKAAKDRHELVHRLPTTDFEEQDQVFLSKPRGGRKRVSFDKIEGLYLSKRGRVSYCGEEPA